MCLGESFRCLRRRTDKGSLGTRMALELVTFTGLRPARVWDACMVAHLHLGLDVWVVDLTRTVLAEAALAVCALRRGLRIRRVRIHVGVQEAFTVLLPLCWVCRSARLGRIEVHYVAVIRAKVPIIDHCVILVDRFFGIVDDFVREVRQLLVGIHLLDGDYVVLIYGCSFPLEWRCCRLLFHV